MPLRAAPVSVLTVAYLDAASTEPLHPAAREALMTALDAGWADPARLYGTARRVPIDESHPLQAQSPYAASKIAADKLAESYHLSFGLPVVTLRPFNTYGPRQSTRAVIPTIVSQLAAGSEGLELGALTPTRDLLYVADTAQAFIAAATAPLDAVAGTVLNAGTGRETPIGALAELIAGLMGRQLRVVTEAPERMRPPASEVMRLVADASRLRELTGWRPSRTLEEGLAAPLAWFTADARQVGGERPATFSL